MLNAIVGDNSEFEDLSDIDDPAIDGENIPPDIPEAGQQSSDDSDSESKQRARGRERKRQCCKSVDYEPGAPVRHGVESRGRGSKRQRGDEDLVSDGDQLMLMDVKNLGQDLAMMDKPGPSTDDHEEPRAGPDFYDDPDMEQPSHEYYCRSGTLESDQECINATVSDHHGSDHTDSEPQHRPHVSEPKPKPSKAGRQDCWKRSAFTPDLVQFEAQDERQENRENWQALDYVEQYIDTELMELIADCTNAMSLATTGTSLNTSADEIYHFFGASIFMSCVPYPQVRMFWSNFLRIPVISDQMTRDRFFKLRQHLKVVIDNDISEDVKKTDRFWKVRPFMDHILNGCLLQSRPECVSIDEQMIPFTGACPFRQYVSLKPNPVGMKNFVLASLDGIILDFEVYQGAVALSSQVREAEGLSLGALVIERLAKTLPPGTKVHCDRSFPTMKAVDRMLEKKVYLIGTVMKNHLPTALPKLPNDKTSVKWYDNKPVLRPSVAHAEEPLDTCQQWCGKEKRYVAVTRPSIVYGYNSKMGGVDLNGKMMRYYRMSPQTKKWTVRMLMHFTDLALANSWLLYCQDNRERGTPNKDVMQFLEFRMAVAQGFLTKRDTDVEHVHEEAAHASQEGHKRHVTPVPPVSVRTTCAVHIPEMVNLKNPMRCREKGCSGKSRVRCMKCDVYLCLQTGRNCFATFHTSK